MLLHLGFESKMQVYLRPIISFPGAKLYYKVLYKQHWYFKELFFFFFNGNF